MAEPAPTDGSSGAARLRGIVRRFAGQSVLVVGDLVLDEYVVGSAVGLSREAPIPVLEFRRRTFQPGAAANPAQNLVALGGRALAAGVVGVDEASGPLHRELARAGVDASCVVTDPSRPTSTKTRIVAEDGTRVPQQVARIDRLDRRDLDEGVRLELLSGLAEQLPVVDAILLSDYKSGVLGAQLVGSILELARTHGKLVTVDSQGDLTKFTGCDVVKCNQAEAEAALRRPLATDESVRIATEELRRDLAAGAVVITRGGAGLAGFGPDGFFALPAYAPSRVFDVTGAGDTVIAVLTLALVAGATLVDAAHLANFAAGLVVRLPGNATVAPDELLDAVVRTE